MRFIIIGFWGLKFGLLIIITGPFSFIFGLVVSVVGLRFGLVVITGPLGFKLGLFVVVARPFCLKFGLVIVITGPFSLIFGLVISFGLVTGSTNFNGLKLGFILLISSKSKTKYSA